MATQIWLGSATAVAEVATATFTTYNTGTTRHITIGGTGPSEAVVVSAADSGGSLTAALTAFAAVLNASTHPYFSTITWSSDGSGHIIGTAKTAGVPFVFAGSDSASTCSNAFTVSTASAGPNDWSTAANWSSGSVPTSGDDVYIKNNAVNIAWGLAQSGVTLNSLTISKSYTGDLGLNTAIFAVSADGATASTTAEVEYRQAYLQISSTLPINIGENASIIGNASGSGRIMIDVGSVASQTIQILGTASSATETGKAAVRMLANASTINIYVRSAPGGFGLAMDIPGETATIGNLYVSDTSSSSQIVTGNGSTITLLEQVGGRNLLQATATVTTLNVKGGIVQTEGTYAITTANVYSGGTLTSNSTGTIGTLNLYGGTTNFTQSAKSRTVTSTVWAKGSDATLRADSSIITFTGITLPATKFSVAAS